jgi:anti-anti-sigma factor
MTDGRVTHSAQDGQHVLRYYGRIDYTIAPAIERFATALLETIEPGTLVFDVCEAEMLDSTNLGLIARLACTQPSDRPPRIISTNDDITDVIRSMGLERSFEIVTEASAHAGAEEPIAVAAPSRGDLLRTMLDAHRVLAAMDESDRARFRDVVACLEAELDAGTHAPR